MELEAQNSTLEVLLKDANERKIDIAPLKEHSLMLRGKIHQVQIKLAEEVFKIKQVEAWLQQISVVDTKFKEKTQEIFETLQGQLTWLETNIEHLENAPVKSPEKLQIKCDIVNFSSKVAERLIEVVEQTTEKCAEFHKKML